MTNTEQTSSVNNPATRAAGDEPRRNTPPATPSYGRVYGPKRLRRNPDGPVGGVATGIADYLGIDPVITRIAFLLAALSGFGLAAYLVCWIVMPMAPRVRQLAQQGSPDVSH
jgi:phage shock protein PspC (stress-responsive transcriptional regulator)